MSKLRFNTAMPPAGFVTGPDVPRRWSTGGAYGTKRARFARVRTELARLEQVGVEGGYR
jgi:hypothetical protein